MNAFLGAIDVLFADPNLAVDAAFTPDGGATVAVRVILVRPDREATPFLQGGFKLSPASQDAALAASVRKSEVETPARDDILSYGGRDYPIRDVDLDREGLVWTLTLGKPS